MKYTWEIEDFQAGRRVWGSSNAPNCECIIGYNEKDRKGWPDRNATEAEKEAHDTRWCIVSQSDGAVYVSGKTKQGIIDFLNEGGYRPLTIVEPYMKHRLTKVTDK